MVFPEHIERYSTEQGVTTLRSALTQTKLKQFYVHPKIWLIRIQKLRWKTRLVTSFDARRDSAGMKTLQIIVSTTDDIRELFYLCALLCSNLMNYWATDYLVDDMNQTYLESLPIRRITFTTPPDEREQLAAEGRDLAHHATRNTQHVTRNTHHVPYADFLTSPLGAWLDARLTAEPAQADAVHDLLAHLAEQMIELHKERQRLEQALDPFKYLDKGARFVPFPEAFAEEIKYGERVSAPVDLGAVHHDIDGLRLVREGECWVLEVQLKQRDPDAAWRAWQYDEGGHQIARRWVGAYRFTLDAVKARYYQHAFRVLDAFAEAGSFPGGYTRSTAKKLQLTEVPAFDAAADLAPLVALSEDLSRVQAHIAATDRLIDLVVYRLYGLTVAEVGVGEGG